MGREYKYFKARVKVQRGKSWRGGKRENVTCGWFHAEAWRGNKQTTLKKCFFLWRKSRLPSHSDARKRPKNVDRDTFRFADNGKPVSELKWNAIILQFVLWMWKEFSSHIYWLNTCHRQLIHFERCSCYGWLVRSDNKFSCAQPKSAAFKWEKCRERSATTDDVKRNAEREEKIHRLRINQGCKG